MADTKDRTERRINKNELISSRERGGKEKGGYPMVGQGFSVKESIMVEKGVLEYMHAEGCVGEGE